MTSPTAELPERKHSTFVTWRNRIIAGVAAVVVLWVTYLILASFIPRWWAQRIASAVHGSFAKGIWSGMLTGFLCTALPLFLLMLAVLIWRRRAGRFVAGAAVILALLTAIPNLMTLTIVLGGSTAAHAGERILDVDAPAYRGAALWGAIIAALLFLLVLFLVVRKHFRRHRAGKARPAIGKPQTSIPVPPERTEPEAP